MTRLALTLIDWFRTKRATPSIATNAYRSRFATNNCGRTRATIRALATVALCYPFRACFTLTFELRSREKTQKFLFSIRSSLLREENVVENISIHLPDHPGAHLHVNFPSPSKHMPLFLHGFGKQSFKSIWIEIEKLKNCKVEYKIMDFRIEKIGKNHLLCSQCGPVKP